MKLRRSEAIILHTVPVRERDKLVVFLTPEHGKRRGFAYGARSLRSRFGAALETLAKVQIGFVEREGEETVRIESVDLIRSLFPAQQNLLSSVAATYFAELVDTFAQPDDPAELTYRLIDKASEALLSGARPMPVVAYVELWILRLAGIFPSIRTCHQCGEALNRPLQFDDRALGFVCEACAGRDSSRIPNVVAETLDLVGRLPISEFAALTIPDDVLFEARGLAGIIRRSFLGHELKSFEVLASIRDRP